MTVIIDYVVQYLPVIFAVLSEVGIVKYAINNIAQIKLTTEFKQVLAENKLLQAQVKQTNKRIDELLTVIDRIQRKESISTNE